MGLTLNLTKEGEGTPQKLQLNLSKDEHFKVYLAWEGHCDLDVHALLCTNDGGSASVRALEDILSCYNVKRAGGGILPKKADGSFEIHNGALIHSPDATDGDLADIDEFIRINPSKLPLRPGVSYEIPIIAMIHPQSSGAKFRDIKNAWISIKDSSETEIAKVQLSSQFGEFIGVQMGTFMVDENGKTEYVAAGSGFQGDFNSVLGFFSE